jgi:hypothetical protein
VAKAKKSWCVCMALFVAMWPVATVSHWSAFGHGAIV